MLEDTIAAIATPLGEAGLSVIRVSGKDALLLVDRIYQSPSGQKKLVKQKSHTLHYGFIYYQGELVDEVMIAIMKGPKSYTAEEVVEIQCHGGILTSKKVLESVLASGARLATPGEFTRRAFINGRIDLTQAEAVHDLIHARSSKAMQVAKEQMQGALSRKIETVRDDLLSVLAHVEAHIDFPDEDIAPDTIEMLSTRILNAIAFSQKLIDSAEDGRLLRQGIRTVIVGKPNAGKSSLLNLLLGEERAIVSDVEGTTRDTIEEFASINGVPIIFIDTAGIRETHDKIEREGIKRSRASIESADLVLHIIDITHALHKEDLEFHKQWANKNIITVCNKHDLNPSFVKTGLPNPISLSCKTEEGIDSLKQQIGDLFWSGEIDNSSDQVMINSRHEVLLKKAQESLVKAKETLAEEWSLEITAMELRLATGAIGEIVGKTSTEDLLDKIFSEFCLGK